MKSRTTLLAALGAVLLLLGFSGASAQASFGLKDFKVAFTNADGSPATLAGSHPFAATTSFGLNYTESTPGFPLPDGQIKDLLVEQASGFLGDATAYPPCKAIDFLTVKASQPECGDDTAVGIVGVSLKHPNEWYAAPVYNLTPPPGSPAELGFVVAGINVSIDVGVRQNPDQSVHILGGLHNTPQSITVFGSSLQLWGNPSDPAHDRFRGRCYGQVSELPVGEKFEFEPAAKGCPVVARGPFLTLPTRCSGPADPLRTGWEADSWSQPGQLVRGEAFSGDLTGCGELGFHPEMTSQATTASAGSATGLDFSLAFADEGLKNNAGRAQSEIKRTAIALPEGMTVNPSAAEGLSVCSPAQLANETLSSDPGQGCPNASKIGSVRVQTPLVDEAIEGSVFLAAPDDPATTAKGAENPFDSLLAFYIVLRNKTLGVLVKLPAKVEPDARTGQLVTTVDEIPQFPFSRFDFHFREGQRAPLITPPACGTYTTRAELTPWARPEEAITDIASFQITHGVGAGPCPSGGTPPFHPGLAAGTLNNAAGRFSPFDVRLSREDSEQEITHFSIKLPPGIAGKLAGIPFCSDQAVATAKAREHAGGGKEELAGPSCPAASEVGRTLAGSGVGSALTYVPGKVYLAGPYHGSPISLVSITSGVVGPFDIGTVVVRLAIKVNPETGEVFLDSTGSDPIPHIIEGIPVHLRDIRAYTDRPEFTFNPTSCERTSTASTLLGSGLDFASEADDRPVTITSPFQAADCAALPFKPKLSLKLVGGTKRGAHPALKALLRMNGFGEAGVARARVTLPSSEFIENAHFNTICTRVQFKEAGGNGEACPQGSIYGWARAKTPILSEPLEGPVFLRSSEHQLPDVVASLRGQEINVHLVGHVDSVKGRLRTTFESVPDAPVEWASFSFKGASKGLFVNSTNLCKRAHRATVKFAGHNGKQFNYGTPLKVKCAKAKKHKRRAG